MSDYISVQENKTFQLSLKTEGNQGEQLHSPKNEPTS